MVPAPSRPPAPTRPAEREELKLRSERQRPGFDRLHEFMERRRVTLVQFSERSTVDLAWLYAKLGGVAQDFRR